MQKSEAFIINRLIWKAGKYNLPGTFSLLFNDLPLSKQEFLKSQLAIELSGMPILYFTKPTGEWTLLCTRQVICNDVKSVISLDISEIKRILPTAFDPTQLGKKIDISTIKKKSEWDTIQIIDKQDNSYILHADKGSDLFALWNILLMMVGLYS
jgi:hypothetical protein